MRITVLAVAAASLFALPVHADDTMITLKPEQIGQIFCLSRVGNDEAVISGILTEELAAAIDGAWTANEAWEKANPGDKPPLGDGIPWQSWPDYAAGCDVGLVTLMKTDAKVEIRYHFPDAPDADFTDMLLLKRVDAPEYQASYWRIDNIAFSTGGDLKASLAQPFEAI
jgi:hypothetical protein